MLAPCFPPLLTTHPPRSAGGNPCERLTFCGPPRCRAMPSPSRALARAAAPLPAAHRGGMLAPAAGAAAAPVATARAAFDALHVLARAGLFLWKARARGGPGAPPPPPRRPPHHRAPAPRAPDTLSSPLPSLTLPSPSSLPSQLTPPTPLTPLSSTPISPHDAPPPCRRTESLVGCSSFVGVRST